MDSLLAVVFKYQVFYVSMVLYKLILMVLEFQVMETKATLKQIGCENYSLFANILL